MVLRIGRIGRPVPADARPSRTGSAAATGTSGRSLPSPSWRGSATAPAPGSSGTWPFIDPSVCPSITMRAAPYCPASLPISSTTNADVRIVELLDFLAVHVARDLLVQIPRVREEVDHDRLGQDLVLLALRPCRRSPARSGCRTRSSGWRTSASAPSFWMTEKSITWSNGVCSVTALIFL